MNHTELISLLDKAPYDPLVLLVIADCLEEHGELALASGYREVHKLGVMPYYLTNSPAVRGSPWVLWDGVESYSPHHVPRDIWKGVFEASNALAYMRLAYFPTKSAALIAYATAWAKVHGDKFALITS